MKAFFRFTAAAFALASLGLAAVVEKRANSVSGYAAAGGTTGGAGGATTRVSTLAALTAAVASDTAKIVVLTASLSGNVVIKVGSNTSLYGASSSVTLTGIGLRVLDKTNVIIRNLKITKVIADTGDHIGVQNSSKVWLDHLELWSDMTHDKDYYDGLLDVTHGCTYVTISYVYFHDHYKVSLVGHSDSNGTEDKKITVTYHHNFWKNTNSRTPSVRFGTVHIYNDYFTAGSDGVNTRQGALVLIENSVFSGVNDAVFEDGGYACLKGVDLGGGTNTAPVGSACFTPPYSYTLDSTSTVVSSNAANAGAKLTF